MVTYSRGKKSSHNSIALEILRKPCYIIINNNIIFSVPCIINNILKPRFYTCKTFLFVSGTEPCSFYWWESIISFFLSSFLSKAERWISSCEARRSVGEVLIDIDLYFLIRKHEVKNEWEDYNLLGYEVYSFSKSEQEGLFTFEFRKKRDKI